MRSLYGRYWRAVLGYRLRCVLHLPYRHTVDREGLQRRYGV